MPEEYKTASGRRLSETLRAYTEGQIVPALSQALYAEGNGIIEQSIGLVPVKTGALRNSNYVAPPEWRGNTIMCDFGYGGVASQKPVPLVRGKFKVQKGGKIGGPVYKDPMSQADPKKYAIYVHENLEAFHPVGMAKYLEIPFRRALDGMASRIADFVRNVMQGRDPIGSVGPEVDYDDVVF